MKLSIITINYNDAIGLKKTIDSVVHQSFSDFEYIIIDGGSTDGSVEIIKENADHINYWVSEPDRGIYNAMNKGIEVAKGEYLLFLNGGDWFCNEDSLGLLANETNNFDIIYGDNYFYYSANKIQKNNLPDLITFNYLAFLNSIPHQATLIKREFMLKNGLYDENLKIASDYKFFLVSFFKWGCSYKHVSQYISYYDLNGISSTNRTLALSEIEIILKEEFPNFHYVKDQMAFVHKLIFYYKYPIIIRILKALRLVKKFDYPKSLDY